MSVCIRTGVCTTADNHTCRLPGAWCQYQVHDSGLWIRDITISTQQPNLLLMPCFTGSFSGYQDQFSYHPNWWLWYMHPQEVVLRTSCDTSISLFLKILLFAVSWQYSRDAISFSFSITVAIYGGPKDNPYILRRSVWRMLLYHSRLKIGSSFSAFEVLAEIPCTINDFLFKC